MNKAPRSCTDTRAPNKHPTTRIGAFIIVVVLLVISTLVFNAVKSKRAYARQHPHVVVATPTQ